MNRVPFVNLNKEYTSIKKEINAAIGNVFSNSSFITDAGRSMTSPAAILLMRSSGRSTILGII